MSALPSFSFAAAALLCGGGGCQPRCSARTSRRIASGNASKNDGSTPSGIGIPSIVKAEASPLVPGCSASGAGVAAVSPSEGAAAEAACVGSAEPASFVN